MIPLVSAWILMCAASGSGPGVTVTSWLPVAAFETRGACVEERQRQRDDYAKFLVKPIEKGTGYVVGVPAGWPSSRQLWVWRCEPTLP